MQLGHVVFLHQETLVWAGAQIAAEISSTPNSLGLAGQSRTGAALPCDPVQLSSENVRLSQPQWRSIWGGAPRPPPHPDCIGVVLPSKDSG